MPLLTLLLGVVIGAVLGTAVPYLYKRLAKGESWVEGQARAAEAEAKKLEKEL